MNELSSQILGVFDGPGKFHGTAFLIDDYIFTCAHVVCELVGSPEEDGLRFRDVEMRECFGKLIRFQIGAICDLIEFQKMPNNERERCLRHADIDLAIFKVDNRRSENSGASEANSIELEHFLRFDTFSRSIDSLEAIAPFFPRSEEGKGVEWIKARCIGETPTQYLFSPDEWEDGFSGAPACDLSGNVLGIVTRYRTRSKEGHGARFRVAKSVALSEEFSELEEACSISLARLNRKEAERLLSRNGVCQDRLMKVSFRAQNLEVEGRGTLPGEQLLSEDSLNTSLELEDVDRILIVGDSLSGKTTFINMYMSNTSEKNHLDRKFFLYIDSYHEIKKEEDPEEICNIIIRNGLRRKHCIDQDKNSMKRWSDFIVENKKYHIVIILDNIEDCASYNTSLRLKKAIDMFKFYNVKIIMIGTTCPQSNMFIDEKTLAYRLLALSVDVSESNKLEEVDFFKEKNSSTIDFFVFDFLNKHHNNEETYKNNMTINPTRKISQLISIEKDKRHDMDDFSFNRIIFGLEILATIKCFEHLSDDEDEFLGDLFDASKDNFDLFDLIDILNRECGKIPFIDETSINVAGFRVDFVHSIYRDYFAARFLDRLSRSKTNSDLFYEFMDQWQMSTSRRAIIYCLTMGRLNKLKKETLRRYYQQSKSGRTIGFLFAQIVSYGVIFDDERFEKTAYDALRYYFNEWIDTCVALFSTLNGHLISRVEFFNLYQMPKFLPLMDDYAKSKNNSLATSLRLLGSTSNDEPLKAKDA